VSQASTVSAYDFVFRFSAMLFILSIPMILFVKTRDAEPVGMQELEAVAEAA
jgi:hypothetical protein